MFRLFILLTLTTTLGCDMRGRTEDIQPMGDSRSLGAIAGSSYMQTTVVTTLDDYDVRETPIVGSLRWALEVNPRPRYITFEVGGPINLVRRLYVKTPNTVIDGSTAKAPGITIQRYSLEVVDTHHVVLRDLRFRCGAGWATTSAAIEGHGGPNSGGLRSLLIGAMPGKQTTDVSVEYCSIQDSTDDNGNVWGDCRRIALRNCLFSGGAPYKKGFLAGHPSDAPKPTPVYDDWLILDRCVFVDEDIRVPDLAGGIFCMVNCIVIDPLQGSRLTNRASGLLLMNAFFVRPNHPWGDNKDRPIVIPKTAALSDTDNTLTVVANMLDGGVQPSSKIVGFINGGTEAVSANVFKSYTPHPMMRRPAVPGPAGLADVLRDAGCTRPVRDKQDQDMIAKAIARVKLSVPAL